MSIVSANIIDIEECVDKSGRRFLAYTIETARNKLHLRQQAIYQVQRRFADFVALHEALQPESEGRREFPVPRQPLSSALNMPLSPQQTRDRANGLQEYLQQLISQPPRTAEGTRVLHTFLGVGASDSDPSVIIVGGGIAGLAAAHTLTKLGVDDFVLLEAADRLGGRVHSIDFGGHTIEAGAQWVHGCKDNPIFELVAQLGLHGTVEPDAPVAVRAQNSLDPNLGERVEARLAQLDEACRQLFRLSGEILAPAVPAQAQPPPLLQHGVPELGSASRLASPSAQLRAAAAAAAAGGGGCLEPPTMAAAAARASFQRDSAASAAAAAGGGGCGDGGAERTPRLANGALARRASEPGSARGAGPLSVDTPADGAATHGGPSRRGSQQQPGGEGGGGVGWLGSPPPAQALSPLGSPHSSAGHSAPNHSGSTPGGGGGGGSNAGGGPAADMSVRCALRWCGWRPEDELDAALEHWRWDYEYGDAPDRLSLRHNCAEEYTETDFDSSQFIVSDPRGFSAVAEHLASSVFCENDPRLRLGACVTRIERSARGGALVTTSDGQVRSASLVLITVSIGVLQSAQVAFVPELPLSKLQPLHELQMGAYTRILLAFPTHFWPEDQRHILIAHPRRGHYAVVTQLGAGGARYPPADANLLCVTVTGDEARRVEALTDEEVEDELLALFRSVWGEAPVPPPLAVHVCRWSTSPLFHGAFSVIPPNALSGGFAKLQQPVGPIHFAGEAFHERYSGFVHGAYLSGVSAAEAMAERLASAPARSPEAARTPPGRGAQHSAGKADAAESPLFKNINIVRRFDRPSPLTSPRGSISSHPHLPTTLRVATPGGRAAAADAAAAVAANGASPIPAAAAADGASHSEPSPLDGSAANGHAY